MSIGPVEIAGYYTQLAMALREQGVDALAVDISGHPFRYNVEPPASAWIRLAAWAAAGSRRVRGRFIGLKVMWRAIQVLARLMLLAWSLRRFDGFIFGYGTTILYGRDLPLLRLLGKRIVFVFNGSDARPPYIDGSDMAASLGRTVDDCIRLARRKKAMIRRVERHAHAVVAQPAFSHFFERPVVDFFRVGLPWTPAPEPPGGGWSLHADSARVRSAQFDWTAESPMRLSGDPRGVDFDRLASVSLGLQQAIGRALPSRVLQAWAARRPAA